MPWSSVQSNTTEDRLTYDHCMPSGAVTSLESIQETLQILLEPCLIHSIIVVPSLPNPPDFQQRQNTASTASRPQNRAY
jgi:hypothetical protein